MPNGNNRYLSPKVLVEKNRGFVLQVMNNLLENFKNIYHARLKH